MRALAWLLLGLCALLAACGPRPEPVKPALWQVEGPLGRKAWLFGTIHSLDRPALWNAGKVAEALAGADTVVVEIADLSDEKAMAQSFESLSRTPNQPPLSDRVSPELRDALHALEQREGFDDSRFADVETWAAALTLARAGGGSLDSRYGIDRAVIAWASDNDRPVFELEGADSQLRLFDALPEPSQRVLLDAAVRDGGRLDSEGASLADAWRKGDMQLIERETFRGILSDPAVRAVLFSNRNADWTDHLIQMMADGAKPFVAVGAAHMAGPDGLPSLLQGRGYTVTRIQ